MYKLGEAPGDQVLSRRRVDLDDIVNGQRLRGRLLLFVAVAIAILMSDGFDISVMGYIGPELISHWHVPPNALVPAYSAAIVGMMLGGPLLGLLGDRLGRKRITISGLIGLGCLTLATVGASTIPLLVGLRFLTGIAIGGIIPNIVALLAELTPARDRGRVVVVVTLGVPFGIAVSGWVAAALIPLFGWRALLGVGGVLPLTTALACWSFIPESIKYLSRRADRREELQRTAHLLRPDLQVGYEINLNTAAGVVPRRVSTRQLFERDLALVTPLLWIMNAANQMANFFALTWLPTLLQSAGASAAEAGVNGSLFALGGFASGIGLLFVIDRVGVVPLVILFLAGTPLVAAMAMADMTPLIHAIIIAGAGLCVTGTNLGLTALVSVFYPTEIKSAGIGWAQAAGRVGALAAPVIGGALLAWHLRMQVLPLAPAAALAIGGCASIILCISCYRRFGNLKLRELNAPTPSPA